MGLMEFLRQWQRSRLATGVTVSVALHLGMAALIFWNPVPHAGKIALYNSACVTGWFAPLNAVSHIFTEWFFLLCQAA